MSFAWAKEKGELPPGRCTDSGFGVLIITAVEAEDSGTYVCTVTAGTFMVKQALELQVEGWRFSSFYYKEGFLDGFSISYVSHKSVLTVFSHPKLVLSLLVLTLNAVSIAWSTN